MGQSLSQNRIGESPNRISIVPKSDTIIKIIIKQITLYRYNHSIRALALKTIYIEHVGSVNVMQSSQ